MRVIAFFMIGIFLCNGIFAISGVSPKSYEVDFEPNYEGDFNFNFVIDGSSYLYVEGELSKYVSLDKKKISGREKVVASLSLPPEIDSPGINQIKIVAGEVFGIIKIKVPYPDKYVELELRAPNVNIGEIIEIDLDIFNRGESVVVEPKIEIYKGDDKIEILEIEKGKIESGEFRSFDVFLNSSDYSAGDYSAVAVVEYEGLVAQIENLFRAGELHVKILNYTKEFRKNKIDKFEIEIESLWDNNINDLFAEINIVGVEGAGFVTPSIGLKAWESKKIVGFLNSAKISDQEFEAEIILHYDGKTSSQVVWLKIIEGFDYVFYGVAVGCLIIFGVLAWKGKRFIEKYKRDEKL